jgi:hypothetical protein
MIKYRLGFTMSAETLFALLGKVLPIEDLAVEEIVVPDPAIRFDKRFDLPKPAKKPRRSGGPNLESGVNKVIMDALAKGPMRAVDLKRDVLAAGYAATGIGSRLERLLHHKVIRRLQPGIYEVPPQERQKQSA